MLCLVVVVSGLFGGRDGGGDEMGKGKGTGEEDDGAGLGAFDAVQGGGDV